MKVSLRNVRLLTIGCFIVGTTALHYGAPHHLMYLHVFLQALFFIPVFLSGLWFGKRGGILAAAAIFLVYIHHAVTVMMPSPEMAVGNGIQILLFFMVGALTGTYSDMRDSYHRATQGGGMYPAAPFPGEQKLLIYLDNSSAAMNAVSYVAHTFRGVPDMKVVLLRVKGAPEQEFPAQEEHAKQESGSLASRGSEIIGIARSLLLQSGFLPTNVETRYVERGTARVSDVLLVEQESGGYSAIVVGRHRLTRSEEFLFGSVAIRLARQANCPVWIIGETAQSKNPAEARSEATPDALPASLD